MLFLLANCCKIANNKLTITRLLNRWHGERQRNGSILLFSLDIISGRRIGGGGGGAVYMVVEMGLPPVPPPHTAHLHAHTAHLLLPSTSCTFLHPALFTPLPGHTLATPFPPQTSYIHAPKPAPRGRFQFICARCGVYTVNTARVPSYRRANAYTLASAFLPANTTKLRGATLRLVAGLAPFGRHDAPFYKTTYTTVPYT